MGQNNGDIKRKRKTNAKQEAKKRATEENETNENIQFNICIPKIRLNRTGRPNPGSLGNKKTSLQNVESKTRRQLTMYKRYIARTESFE